MSVTSLVRIRKTSNESILHTECDVKEKVTAPLRHLSENFKLQQEFQHDTVNVPSVYILHTLKNKNKKFVLYSFFSLLLKRYL